MTENESAADKRVVEVLDFGSRTAKRVGWEAFEFTVEGPHLVRVTNASYGFEKDDHSYLVCIEEREGLLVPAECECKADRYNEEYDCKHKVALATIAGPVVLQAAVDCPTPGVEAEKTPETMAARLETDGGTIADESDEGTIPLDAREREECDCDGLRDDFPCADCYIKGRKEMPE